LRVKILIVTGIFPPDHGGPARYVPTIASELRARGHNVIGIVTLSDDPDYDDSRYVFPVIRLRRGEALLRRVLRTIFAIARLARRADVVYLNGLVLEGMIATKIVGGKPTVIKVVGDLIWEKARNAQATDLTLDVFQEAGVPWMWRVLHWLQGFYTAHADAVIVPSSYLQRIVRGWGVASDRIVVVPNAVPLPGSPKTDLQPHYDLVTVARMVPWKGLAELIDVSASNQWSLRVVGDGPLMADLVCRAVESGANVSFAGHVDEACVVQEFRDARLFVLNSSYEGLPHVVLEAKAAGVAVVATAAGGTPEIVRDGIDGLLVPVGDGPALAEAIRRLLRDEAERKRIIDAGRRQIIERHGFELLADRTEQILAGVCQGAWTVFHPDCRH
jgi:glycosyltransferase involved in cell wall biosynthesis